MESNKQKRIERIRKVVLRAFANKLDGNKQTRKKKLKKMRRVRKMRKMKKVKKVIKAKKSGPKPLQNPTLMKILTGEDAARKTQQELQQQ